MGSAARAVRKLVCGTSNSGQIGTVVAFGGNTAEGTPNTSVPTRVQLSTLLSCAVERRNLCGMVLVVVVVEERFM